MQESEKNKKDEAHKDRDYYYDDAHGYEEYEAEDEDDDDTESSEESTEDAE